MRSLTLLSNIHDTPEICKYSGFTCLIYGAYEYYHYLCDGFDDRGWGCGYRTLQTILSWLSCNDEFRVDVPSIHEIQDILVQMGDKPKSFHKSKEWVGSFEACLVIDQLFGVKCKMIHVNHGDELETIVDDLVNHFEKFGSPIMMGGDVDCASKGIVGIHVDSTETSLLVLDPHYVGMNISSEFLYHKGCVKWQKLSEFMTSSFYNLCLPQIKGNPNYVDDDWLV